MSSPSPPSVVADAGSSASSSALLASWSADAESRARRIHAASKAAQPRQPTQNTQQDKKEQQFNAFLAAHSIGTRASASAAGPSSSLPSSASAIRTPNAAPPSTAAHPSQSYHIRPLPTLMSPSAEHMRALAEHESTRDRMEAQLARHKAFLESLTDNAPISPIASNNTKSAPSRHNTSSAALQQQASVASVPANSSAPTNSSTATADITNHQSATNQQQPNEGYDTNYPSQSTSATQSPSVHNRSVDHSTPRSTNSFGYDEYMLSDNVFVLAEKHPSSAGPHPATHHTRAPTNVQSTIRTNNNESMKQRGAYDGEEDEGESALRSSTNHTLIDRTLEATTPHTRHTDAATEHWNATHMDEILDQLRSHDATFDVNKFGRPHRSSPPVSPPSIDSLNTSAISQAYLPSALAGPNAGRPASSRANSAVDTKHDVDLFALAHIGLGLDQLATQKKMAEPHTRQNRRTNPTTSVSTDAARPRDRSADHQAVISQSHRSSSHSRSLKKAAASSPASSRSPSNKKHSGTPGFSSSAATGRIPQTTNDNNRANRSPQHANANSHTNGNSSAASSSPASPTTNSPSPSHLSSSLHANGAIHRAPSMERPLNRTQQPHQPPAAQSRSGGWTPADSAAAIATRQQKARALESSAGASSRSTRAPLATGAARRPSSSTSSSKTVPVLSVTSGPEPIVVAKVSAATGRPIIQASGDNNNGNKKRSNIFAKAKPLPRDGYNLSLAFEASMAGEYDDSYDDHQLDDQDLLDDDDELPHQPPHSINPLHTVAPRLRPTSTHANTVGSYSSIADEDDPEIEELESEVQSQQVEAQLHHMDSVLEQKLRAEIRMLRAESGHGELFDNYEHTIAQLQRQNANLRLKVHRTELHPDLLRAVRSPTHKRNGGTYDDDDDPHATKQAHFRVIETSYRKLQDEYRQLQSSYASLQKQSRRFLLQSKQCATLESRVQEHVGIVRTKERDLVATRKELEARNEEIEELKQIIFETTQENNKERAKTDEAYARIDRQKSEIEALTHALFESRSANILQQVRPTSSSHTTSTAIKRKHPIKLVDRLSELTDLETIFLEARKSDTPLNLVAMANRRGIELCNRLRTQIELIDKEKTTTQENEKALLLLVMKLQEKKKAREIDS